jgi:iron complex outermembrane receptor protein
MKYCRSILAASIAASLYASAVVHAGEAVSVAGADARPGVTTPDTSSAPADAQTTPSNRDPDQLGTIVVTGIRESLKASLDRKRDADATIEAITAEDIGKFPATNVAEALEQIPGVTLDRSIPATQRVSIDGCDPSLNLSYLDGHPVAQATWLFGDSPNRGFNYSLLAPEIIGSLEVYKTAEARLPEGSLCGTVFMHTVQPLDVDANTLRGSITYNYNDMVSDGKPNGSIFYSWHSDDKTWGVDFSAQHYEQFSDRQGLENYGYSSVASLNTAALASGNHAIQDELDAGKIKATDQMPNQLSAANFEQVEKRDSINVNLQFKPTDNFQTSLGLLYMKDNLNNVNQSMYAWASLRPGGITSLTEGPNGIITSGASTDPSAPCAGDTAGACGTKAISLADNFARESHIKTQGADWQTKFSGDGWRLTTQVGVSTSSDPMTQTLKEIAYGGSFTWNTAQGFNFTDPATANNPAYWADYGWGGNHSLLIYKARDVYGQADVTKDLDGFFNQLLFGVRYASHWESQDETVWSGATAETLNQIGYGGITNLSGGSSLGLTGSTIHHVQTCGFDCIIGAVRNAPNYNDLVPDPNSTWENTWNVQQKNTAAYGQVNFGSDNLHGNFGLRFVRTENTSFGYNIPGSCLAADSWNCVFPEGFGYVGQKTTHNDVLPSFNIADTIAPDVILRGAFAEQIAYAPYNQMAPYFEANDTVLTATAGNPNLDPYKSFNYSGSAEWYFAPESVLAATLFYKNITNYIVNAATIQERINGSWTLPGYINSTGNAQIAAGNCTAAGVCQYDVTAPVNGGHADVKGFLVSYQQPFGDTGFGLRANYTYSDASTSKGGALPYNSKNSYNVAPYFEKGPFSASLAYNYRSSYLAGGYVAGAPATFVDGYKEFDGSLGYTISDNLSLNFNALNLLNSKYFQYLGSKTQLSAEYKQGREYLLTLHFKL